MKSTEREVKNTKTNTRDINDNKKNSPDKKQPEQQKESEKSYVKKAAYGQKVRSAIDEEKMQMIQNRKRNRDGDRLTDQQKRERIENMSFSHLYY